MKKLLAVLLVSGVAAGEITLENMRMVVSDYGPQKKDARYVPGEKVYLLFDAVGAEEKDGQVAFILRFEALTPKGETLGKYDGEEQKAADVFGRGSIRCSVYVGLPPDAPAGTYSVNISVEDRVAKKKAETKVEFEVVATELTTINAKLTVDQAGENGHGPFVADGESLYLRFTVAGLKTEGGKAKLTVNLVILDGAGKELRTVPYFVDAEVEVADGLVHVPMGIHFTGRGKYTVRGVVKDLLAGTETTCDYPVHILAPPK
ncbi:MAG: hypothetical protein AAB434_11670 [Planctomycetota bacterium]